MPSTDAHRVPRRQRPLLQKLGRAALALARWRIVGDVPDVPKFIAIVAPHTSNWDFPLGVLVMFALDLKIHWFGKESLFRSPLGPLFRALGGRPVNRERPEGVVDEIAAIARAEPQFILALAPEGTRKKVARWRTGFYRIAERADMPIVPVSFDWSRREVTIHAPVQATGDIATDLAALQAMYRPEMGRNPAAFWDIGPVPQST
jgi:1-acyl-sn-glycerol-3-phosphate acyltransferase